MMSLFSNRKNRKQRGWCFQAFNFIMSPVKFTRHRHYIYGWIDKCEIMYIYTNPQGHLLVTHELKCFYLFRLLFSPLSMHSSISTLSSPYLQYILSCEDQGDNWSEWKFSSIFLEQKKMEYNSISRKLIQNSLHCVKIYFSRKEKGFRV